MIKLHSESVTNCTHCKISIWELAKDLQKSSQVKFWDHGNTEYDVILTWIINNLKNCRIPQRFLENWKPGCAVFRKKNILFYCFDLGFSNDSGDLICCYFKTLYIQFNMTYFYWITVKKFEQWLLLNDYFEGKLLIINRNGPLKQNSHSSNILTWN